MKKLFPAIRPYQTHSLSVDTIHNLYIEECGNPSGIPIVFIHGGPGGGTRTSDRCFFDPEKYRIILFDQRGCGKSTPHAELKNNNTKNLLSDIEAIRQMLRIERWAVFGGSWGIHSQSCLCAALSQPGKSFDLERYFLVQRT